MTSSNICLKGSCHGVVIIPGCDRQYIPMNVCKRVENCGGGGGGVVKLKINHLNFTRPLLLSIYNTK